MARLEDFFVNRMGLPRGSAPGEIRGAFEAAAAQNVAEARVCGDCSHGIGDLRW